MAKLAFILSIALTLSSKTLGFHPIGNTDLRSKYFLQSFGLDSATILASNTYSSTALFAKRKRRRRKDTVKPSTPKEEITSSNEAADIIEDDELPDFDLDEDNELMAKSTVLASTSVSNSASVASVSVSPAASFDVNDPSVIEAMKATGDAVGNVSTKDLLRSRNRELEQKFVVDEVTTEVPSLADYSAKRRGSSSNVSNQGTVGKKAARAEARRAAAIEAESANEAEENPLSNIGNSFSFLPFVEKTETGEEKSAIKVSPNECANIYSGLDYLIETYTCYFCCF